MELPMRRRTKTRTATTVVLALAIIYLLLAYFVVPEIWVFRDASRVSDLGSMVTHTEQDIPGDPPLGRGRPLATVPYWMQLV